jgi:uncharacterized membrane protein
MGLNKTYQRIFLSFSLFLFLSIIYLPAICARDYYADITIDVDSSGFVTIDGTTNHPDLLINDTEIYTLKKQSYWLLNITKEGVFSDFVYALTLPEGSSINYIKSSGFIRIEENQGNLLVNGFGENESFSIIIQYQTEKVSDEGIIQFDVLYVILTILIIILILVLAVIFIRDKKSKGAVEELKQNEIDTRFKGLNERQKQIMKLLIDRKIPLTQTDIQKELNIPKAAVSRNIHGLERKGLIEKEQVGMSNLIRLKKL